MRSDDTALARGRRDGVAYSRLRGKSSGSGAVGLRARALRGRGEGEVERREGRGSLRFIGGIGFLVERTSCQSQCSSLSGLESFQRF